MAHKSVRDLPSYAMSPQEPPNLQLIHYGSPIFPSDLELAAPESVSVPSIVSIVLESREELSPTIMVCP